MTKRKLLPFLAVAVLMGCATDNNSNEFLVQENRYTKDAVEIAAYRKIMPVDKNILNFEAAAYAALNDARVAKHSTASVTALQQSLVALEAEMAKKGMNTDAGRPVSVR